MDDSGSLSRIHIVAFIIAGLIIISAAVVILTSPPGKISGPYSDENCRVSESGMLIDRCIPLFKVINATNDSIHFKDSDDYQWMKPSSAPLPEECPGYVEKVLEPYGGLPKDAKLSSINDAESFGKNNGTTDTFTEWVVKRRIEYNQVLYGKPIVGHGGYLTVHLRNGGEADYINKKWKTVEEVGMERVIPASEAVLRLQNYEGRFDPPTKSLIHDYIPEGAFNLTISEMELRYFASENPANETYLEPVWQIKTVDTIRQMRFIFYVPASERPAKYVLLKSDFSGREKNFSQLNGIFPDPDLALPQNVLIGTSGPVGKIRAEESVQRFIENPEINLTYNGRYRDKARGCSAGGHQGEYYRFSTNDCLFLVDVYSGEVFNAGINESCIQPGFSGKSETGNITKEDAQSLAERFARQKYPYFEKMHIKPNRIPYLSIYRDGDNYSISLSGDFGPVSESGMYIHVRQSDGLVTQYSVNDDDLQYLCGGPDAPVKIDE